MRYLLPLGIVVAGGIIAWLTWRQSVQEPLVVSGFIEADEIRVGSRVGGHGAAGPATSKVSFATRPATPARPMIE